MQSRTFKIQASIAVAFERTSTEAANVESIVKDINEEFQKMHVDDILKAIRNGSLGKYGITYKLSTQVICLWILEYQRELNSEKYGKFTDEEVEKMLDIRQLVNPWLEK